jgi:hypothetical protein
MREYIHTTPIEELEAEHLKGHLEQGKIEQYRIKLPTWKVIELEVEDVPEFIDKGFYQYGELQLTKGMEDFQTTDFPKVRFDIPPNVVHEIEEELKRRHRTKYLEQVKTKFEAMETDFRNRMQKSPDFQRFQALEIKNWETVFSDSQEDGLTQENKNLRIAWNDIAQSLGYEGGEYNTLRRKRFGQIAAQPHPAIVSLLLQKGYVDTPLRNIYVKAEAAHRFLLWLKKLQANPDRIVSTKDGNKILSEFEQREIECQKRMIYVTACRDLVRYFKSGEVEVHLFRKGNDYFEEQVVEDLAELQAAITGTGSIPTGHRTTMQMDAQFIGEADPAELSNLLQAKFEDYGRSMGFKTLKVFAKAEADKLGKAWANDLDRLPIAGQWLDFLKDIAEPKQQHPAAPIRTLTKMLRERFDDSELPDFKSTKPVADLVTPPQGKEGSTEAESEPKPKAIIFTEPDTITAIHEGLQAFFPERENDLLELLNGGAIENPLHFADQQNKLAEVFSRAYYNGKMGGTKTEVQNWIVTNFTYQNKRTKKKTPFSLDTLKGIFNPTGKGEVGSGKRITIKGLDYIAPQKRVGYAVK